jgi:hypothetical protein
LLLLHPRIRLRALRELLLAGGRRAAAAGALAFAALAVLVEVAFLATLAISTVVALAFAAGLHRSTLWQQQVWGC